MPTTDVPPDSHAARVAEGKTREMGSGGGGLAGERGRRAAVRSISSSYEGEVGGGKETAGGVCVSGSRTPSYGAGIQDLSFHRSESLDMGVQVCEREIGR